MGDQQPAPVIVGVMALADLSLAFAQPVTELALARLDPATGLIEVEARWPL